ncbi:MAG: virulence protein RhuM/Fic/DOC family protein [bacterium]|nr:virulence protein RhuM/Fic/DOC family protein [bacterium]
MAKFKEQKRGEIILYKAKQGPQVEVRLQNETIWLTQAQITGLFGTQRPAITKHLNNIFKSGELDEKAVCSILEHTAKDGKTYKTAFYSLDAVISVGYRVNSKQATQFRIWATRVLREHITKGFTINEKRLLEAKDKFAQLQSTIAFLKEKSTKELLTGQEGEILSLLALYAKTLTILDEYDKGTLREVKGEKGAFVLTYEESKRVIVEVKRELVTKKEAGELFGNEKDDSFKGIIRGLYQTFGGQELYRTLESKAAHLLYLIIKDHSFSDGNKRSASFLFVYFLDKNNALYRTGGEKKINDNALAALALLVAASNPKEKDQMIALITQLLQ